MESRILTSVEFDFAFSFAGEDRDVVEEIHKRLTADGIEVFYDFAYQAQLVGKDLYRGLREIYKNKGKYIVCFISEHYAKKVWTNLEFTAIKERLMSTFFASDFLIPILIGEAEMLEDIPIYIGFYTHRSIDETVDMLKEKINSSISEDHLITNVNNCIAYICPQIRERLRAHNVNATLTNMDELIIDREGRTITFYFSGDTIAQTPCILVTKGNGDFYKSSLSKDPFPSYVITWKKRDGLYFSIHEFDGGESRVVKNQPLSETVKYICSFIEEDIGG